MANKYRREEKREDRETATAGAWLMGALGWLVPGAGHIAQGKWGRGLLLGGAVWVMFVTGLLFGGHLFGLTGRDDGTNPLLQAAPAIANLGTGGLYLFCSLLG